MGTVSPHFTDEESAPRRNRTCLALSLTLPVILFLAHIGVSIFNRHLLSQMTPHFPPNREAPPDKGYIHCFSAAGGYKGISLLLTYSLTLRRTWGFCGGGVA